MRKKKSQRIYSTAVRQIQTVTEVLHMTWQPQHSHTIRPKSKYRGKNPHLVQLMSRPIKKMQIIHLFHLIITCWCPMVTAPLHHAEGVTARTPCLFPAAWDSQGQNANRFLSNIPHWAFKGSRVTVLKWSSQNLKYYPNENMQQEPNIGRKQGLQTWNGYATIKICKNWIDINIIYKWYQTLNVCKLFNVTSCMFRCLRGLITVH